ncbi:hypothetical protein HPB50_014923 [Hyalomma asiaticum]|uniref:Uncharacterized protein n=1 Tax=Hyalomma asiaticum TaxID=266040 RepID=A0ACB7S6M2_HYAAI|nr:hypothetical protein HPB50_014923 [Hyalomma asiaticum]
MTAQSDAAHCRRSNHSRVAADVVTTTFANVSPGLWTSFPSHVVPNQFSDRLRAVEFSMCDISARMHCLAERRSKIGQTVTGKYANAMRVSNSIAAATARPTLFRFISFETRAPNLRQTVPKGDAARFVWFAARPERSEETRASLSPRLPPCATEPSDESYVAPSALRLPPVGARKVLWEKRAQAPSPSYELLGLSASGLKRCEDTRHTLTQKFLKKGTRFPRRTTITRACRPATLSLTANRSAAAGYDPECSAAPAETSTDNDPELATDVMETDDQDTETQLPKTPQACTIPGSENTQEITQVSPSLVLLGDAVGVNLSRSRTRTPSHNRMASGEPGRQRLMCTSRLRPPTHDSTKPQAPPTSKSPEVDLALSKPQVLSSTAKHTPIHCPEYRRV